MSNPHHLLHQTTRGAPELNMSINYCPSGLFYIPHSAAIGNDIARLRRNSNVFLQPMQLPPFEKVIFLLVECVT